VAHLPAVVVMYFVWPDLWDKASILYLALVSIYALVINTEVLKYVDNDFDLGLCRAAANTGKHHTRSNPNAMTAKVGSVVGNSNGVDVDVHWSKGSASGSTDAPALAQNCVASWDRYLKSKGPSSPI
jgi:hypothetical protein